jgi:hypothetical protein
LDETKEIPHEKAVVLLIFIFAVVYRTLLMQVDPYPPGPDLGMHNSIINSIILKNGSFTWNYYHMGGGSSLTHPGFHIFTSFVIFMTGAPEYLAQSAVAILFSSLIVLCAYLLTKKAWGLPVAALLAAFMGAISRHDLEMLLWGGYPNVITLAIMPLIFYMLLREDTPKSALVAVSSILSGTIFFTHSLSSAVFLCIAISLILCKMLILRKTTEEKMLFLFALSIVLGFLVASPFLIEAVPVYFENMSKGMFTGGISESRAATLLTRKVPIEIVLAALIPASSILLFSRKYKGTFFGNASALLVLWILIPAFSTQAFIIGLYTDYYRLLHFLILPVIVFLALFTDHGLKFVAESLGKKIYGVKISSHHIHAILVAAILILMSLNLVPLFAGPAEGFTIANYYDVIEPAEFESIMWIKQNTAPDAVIVSQHGYGWWVSGFGQRVTLSSTDPQFLIMPHEFEAASTARTLLDTDFVLNNGLIEIREDGGYVGRHNPTVSVVNKNYPSAYPILYFNETETTIFYKDIRGAKIIEATEISLKEVKVERRKGAVCISILRENDHIFYTRQIEVFEGLKFGLLSINVEAVDNSTVLDYTGLIIHCKGKILRYEQGIGVLDEGAKILGQLIFDGNKPETRILTPENPTCIELFYKTDKLKKIGIKMILGGFEVEKSDAKYVQSLLANTTLLWFKKENITRPVEVFDYREVMKEKGIAFIAFEKREYPIEKFLNDPTFNLVFVNDKIAIFEVQRSGR